jgi:hypothetical protein
VKQIAFWILLFALFMVAVPKAQSQTYVQQHTHTLNNVPPGCDGSNCNDGGGWWEWLKGVVLGPLSTSVKLARPPKVPMPPIWFGR